MLLTSNATTAWRAASSAGKRTMCGSSLRMGKRITRECWLHLCCTPNQMFKLLLPKVAHCKLISFALNVAPCTSPGRCPLS